MDMHSKKRPGRPRIIPPNVDASKCADCTSKRRKESQTNLQELINCFDCRRSFHPFCSGLTKESTDIAFQYRWRCNDCKCCEACHKQDNEENLVICSGCDRGFHTFCLEPPLDNIPEGDWYCKHCKPSLTKVFRRKNSLPNAQSTLICPSPRKARSTHPTNFESDDLKISTYSISERHRNKNLVEKMLKRKAREVFDEDISPIIANSERSHKKMIKNASLSTYTLMPNKPIKLKIICKTPKQKIMDHNNMKWTMNNHHEYDQTVLNEKKADKPLDFWHGRLAAAEADISKTTPKEQDKELFENARKASESKVVQKQYYHHNFFDISSENQAFALEAPKIKRIRFGDFEIDTWYVAPYPAEYSGREVLWICEFCLKYMKSGFVAGRHRMKCPMKHPPGDEIYRDGNISIFEVDGRKNKIYCQNLCLLAKMFLDHKTLYYDVEPFLFYVMTEVNETGCHFIGYFSKEKRSTMNYNLSCIMTLPIHQKKGYGNYLIDFSYLLSKKEGRTGSPEKPLSDLGLISYRSYWKNVLFEEISDLIENSIWNISVNELCNHTSMTPDDIISTLQQTNLIHHDLETSEFHIHVDLAVIHDHLAKLHSKDYPLLNPDNLTWSPFILTRNMVLFEKEEFEYEERANTEIITGAGKDPNTERNVEDGTSEKRDQKNETDDIFL